MKKILVVDDEQEIRDILQLLLECEFENEIVLANSGQQAIDFLEQRGSEFGVILSDYNMPNGNGGELYQYNCQYTKLPFILVTGGYLDDYPEMKGFLEQTEFKTALITKPFEEEELFAILKKSLAEEQLQNFKVDGDMANEFVRVNIDLFVRCFLGYRPDIFLHLKNGKFVQIFNKSEEISCKDILKYRDKGEREIFLKAEDFKQLKAGLFQAIKEKLAKANSVGAALEATGDTINYVANCLGVLDISAEQLELIDGSVDVCLRELESSDDKVLQDFLTQFNKDQGYLVAHGLTTLHLSYMILRKAGIFSEENMRRLSYAAILHDFEHYHYEDAVILDKQTEAFKQLERKRQESVENHMYWAQEKVNQIKAIPVEVGNLILVHHETPMGTGFPRAITASSFSVLEALFVLALRTAHYIYFNYQDPAAVVKYVDELAKQWNQGPFKRPYKALQEVMREVLKK